MRSGKPIAQPLPGLRRRDRRHRGQLHDPAEPDRSGKGLTNIFVVSDSQQMYDSVGVLT
ncbi:hypothetical protein [Nonomuraea recticatena]|uniref:hypothetical protein n=1 Tax=Nonomuraea recticatena TaxID=46178 RepID=UPI0031F7694F